MTINYYRNKIIKWINKDWKMSIGVIMQIELTSVYHTSNYSKICYEYGRAK